MAVEITNTILSLQPTVEAEPLAPQSFHWQLEDYAYFHKCGEITTSPDVQCFGFNCAFCPAICLQFSVFIDHIRGHHMQELRRRYEGADAKIEQTTQTDLNLMIMDMHLEGEPTQAANATINGTALATTTTTTTTMLNATPTPVATTKRTKNPPNWNEAQASMGLLDMDMGLDLANVVPESALPKTSNNNAALMQLNSPATAAATIALATTTTIAAAAATPDEMNFVYVMENPLPPSPPPSADISRCEQNARLHSIDPFEILHEVCSSAVAHTHTHTQPHTQALAQTQAQAQAHAHAHANTHTHTHTQASTNTNTYEAAESSGAVSVVAHPRYETRRVVS
ncbi:hypothetical protein AWZ03_013833 [Drosophila navojoa]|uniref:Uncharacterized protein n=1 Tax=Drosophila navojoa TaxID=7232 RepID=A0A484AUN6_DRONA|nr:hypothetical protein AWZ03_013833 [Drosophila navojoa]